MKLEKITINGTEYYQFVKIGIINTVGDIFTDWRDIPKEREKMLLKQK